MRREFALLLWALLTLGPAAAQEGINQRALQPWLTGIIAVVVFLFLVFIAFLVNKAWCEQPGGVMDLCSSLKREKTDLEQVKPNEFVMINGTSHELSLETVRSSEHENAYENVAVYSPQVTVTVM
ncbi:PDZK1-interacting protein 1 isoform X1 [Amia ocellicauda]|uniref:PDZK1-interacting protein 1 isoform X1 n=1 Tax=Amia ocellicauda TaxID=2972642 RepID=UPI003464A1EC